MARTKHYGVKEGKEIRATYCASGVSKKGFKWCSFKYNASTYNKEKGCYEEKARYEIWVENGVDVKDGDLVKIERITNVELKKYVSNGKPGTICSMWCNVKVVEEAPQSELELNDTLDFDVSIDDNDLF